MSGYILNARSEATSIMQKLDSRFEPRLYAVAYRIAETKGESSIGIGPDDTPFNREVFANVQKQAAVYESEDSENDSWWSDEGMQRNKEWQIFARALRRATLEAVKASPANEGYTAFCSWPAEHDGSHVILILQVQKSIYDSYYWLKRGAYRARGLHEYRLERSLIEAVASQYLEETRQELTSANPGSGRSNIEDEDHLFVKAAKRLMHTAAVAGGHDSGLYGLFEACQTLSTLKYEGKEGNGRIIVARRDHPHVEVALAWTSPVQVRNFGAVRKFLQMATDDLSLLCDSYEVYGLGKIQESYDPAAEDLFVVQFNKQFIWDLLHDGKRLMHVRYGEASIALPGFPDEQFRLDLPRVFPGIDSASVDRLSELARCASGQKHGCMLVISRAAGDEALRLDNQCTRVEPFPMTEAVMPLVTAIDGSVLIDTAGICHAIGVILDGHAAPQCSPARGSRYNSAIRYVYGRNDAMAIVKSEDGMVNIFPALRPQIRRSEIRNKIEDLRSISAGESIDTTRLSRVMMWLEEHEFYITPPECEDANRLHEMAQEKKPGDVLYVFRDKPLTPAPEMNESYYLPE